jgi:hypothetical protein
MRKQVLLSGQEQGGWRPVEGIAVGTRVVALGRDLVTDGSKVKNTATPAATGQGN